MTLADCINPSAITDDEIIAFALGDQGPQTQEHLDQCLHCRTEALEYQELSRKLMEGAHPASIKLAELAMQMLSASEELVIQAHVRGCANCQTDVADLNGFLVDDVNLMPAGGLAGAIRRIIARPQVPLTPAFGGLRGSGGDETKTYEAEDDLFVIGVEAHQAGRSGRELTGMQVPTPDSATSAALYDDQGQLVQSTELDDVGAFSFAGIRAGTYQVELTSEARTVVIESVEIT